MTAATALPAQASFWPLPIAPKQVSEEPSSIFRFSLEQYHQMARLGILEDNNKVEFLEGILVNKTTMNRANSLANHRLRVLLESLVPEGYYVESQEPTTTTDSEPEPDAIVVRGKLEDYQDQQPPASQVPLIAEVADSSLQQDRNWKKCIYARAGIPVYWIVNLVDRQMEVFNQPSGESEAPDYAQCQVYGLGQELPVILDGKDVGQIAVKDVLP